MALAAPRAGRARLAWRALLAGLMAVILMLALLPGSGQPAFGHVDKLQHAVAFLVLWAVGRRAGLGPAWMLPVLLLGFGVAIELAQAGWTTTRDPSLGDVLADAAGIAVGRWLLGSP
ncbi:VanZ family protein [Ideonella sp.]|uniref:VanZ family protein n=1 Tax=Ideonella sp. TaxID=1929293 RepID=UPI0035AEE35A